MDVYVDTNVLSDANSGVDALISELVGYTNFMTQKITQVNDKFSSKNYDRIVEALQRVFNEINEMTLRLENAKKFISSLIECIEVYSQKTYKG